MNPNIHLYRRRFIPEELISLHKDKIIYADRNFILTRWNTIKPRPDFSCGFSAYFLHKNFRISKMLKKDNELLYWYCDIMQMTEDTKNSSDGTTLIMEDLLIDVVVYPDGSVRVLDLDEAADAAEQGLISPDMLYRAMRTANQLLNDIASGKFNEYLDEINKKIQQPE